MERSLASKKTSTSELGARGAGRAAVAARPIASSARLVTGMTGGSGRSSRTGGGASDPPQRAHALRPGPFVTPQRGQVIALPGYCASEQLWQPSARRPTAPRRPGQLCPDNCARDGARAGASSAAPACGVSLLVHQRLEQLAKATRFQVRHGPTGRHVSSFPLQPGL